MTNQAPEDIIKLAQASGRCIATIYNTINRLGRMPTVEELKSAKVGRPRKNIKGRQ